MKALYQITLVCIILLFCANVFAQPGRNIAKQTQQINGILRATANANTNARIHANSNSVFGTANTHPYNNKHQPKKNEIKPDKEMEKNSKTRNKKK